MKKQRATCPIAIYTFCTTHGTYKVTIEDRPKNELNTQPDYNKVVEKFICLHERIARNGSEEYHHHHPEAIQALRMISAGEDGIEL